MRVFNTKLNDKITLVSVDNDKKELTLNVSGDVQTIQATQLKYIKNDDYVLFKRINIGQVYDYSQDTWQGTKRCFFDLRYIYSDDIDSHYGFFDEDTPVFVINDIINNVNSYTYEELIVYVKKLEQELSELRI